jgi:type VI secretion system FHA domain protein
MILTLEVTGSQEGTPHVELRKVFQASGGTIGRLPDNDWVLPDPYVSSRHARIRYAGGAFQIEDTSTNGVFINSTSNRLVRGQPYTLKSGDRIFIDPYEIRAVITGEEQAAAPAADPFGLDDPFKPAQPSAPPPSSSPFDLVPAVDPLGSGDVDPLSLLGFEEKKAPPLAPRAADLAGSSLLTEHYQAPEPIRPPGPPSPEPPAAGSSAGSLIPDDYDPLGSNSEVRPIASRPAPAPARSNPMPPQAPVSRAPAAAPAPPPAAPAPIPAGSATAPGRATPSPAPARPAPSDAGRGIDVGLAHVLRGAGIDSSLITPELAQNFGEILRVVVAGVMDVLQARQRIKDEFRMRMTTFKTAQNNPLKFSANVDDALHNLLVKRNQAYLRPVEAFEDAFDDIRNHQMAMLAGVRVAFEAMLAEFDPDRLQESFDRHGKGSLLSVPGKLRYWDQYRAMFSDMVSDAEESFKELFGQEFAKAYEEQLERLKAQRRSRD